MLALASGATGAEAAKQVPLMLATNLQDAHPQMVSLSDAAKCKYVGALQQSGASASWSITITRKTCEDGVISPVALVVPLRNLNTEPGYAAGSVVMARPAH
jgi:hypothetical protein